MEQQRFCSDIDFGIREENDPNTIIFWTCKLRKTKRFVAPAGARRIAS